MIRLRELRRKKGMTARSLAERVGVAESTMSLYESGKREPSYRTLLAIAQALEVSVDCLLGARDDRDPSIRSAAVQIPVYGNVAAGIPIEAITDIEDYEEIPARMAAAGEYAALRLKGDSMEPRMMEGDVVIVRVQERVESGDVAIILIGDGDATCKRIMKTEEGIMLLSANPKYEPMFFSHRQIRDLPVRIFGKVVELRAKFR